MLFPLFYRPGSGKVSFLFLNGHPSIRSPGIHTTKILPLYRVRNKLPSSCLTSWVEYAFTALDNGSRTITGTRPQRNPRVSPLGSHPDRLRMLTLALPVNDFTALVLKTFIFHHGFSLEAQDLSELSEENCLCVSHLQSVTLSPLYCELNIFLSQTASFILSDHELCPCLTLKTMGLPLASLPWHPSVRKMP